MYRAVEVAEADAKDKAAQRARLMKFKVPSEQADSESESDEPSVSGKAAASSEKGKEASAGGPAATSSAFEHIAEAQAAAGDTLFVDSHVWPMKPAA